MVKWQEPSVVGLLPQKKLMDTDDIPWAWIRVFRRIPAHQIIGEEPTESLTPAPPMLALRGVPWSGLRVHQQIHGREKTKENNIGIG